MGKTAFIFPGQGAQYVGMGADFYETYKEAKKAFDIAGEATGLDMKALCFEENEKLNQTEYTQVAMLATELAILKCVEASGIKAGVTAGLSLGEYGALACAQVMSPEDCFRVVRKRGLYMQEAYPKGGAMVAVLGTDTRLIETICEETPGIVSVANYNCPGQIVITGEEAAVNAAVEKLKEAGAKRCIPLKVSGPFHSQLLAGAGDKLEAELEGVQLKKPIIPYVTNVDASFVTTTDRIKELLTRQVSGSVRWQQSVELMLQDGVDTFVEIGPGKTLSGFMKKINKDVKVLNIEKVEDLEKAKEALLC